LDDAIDVHEQSMIVKFTSRIFPAVLQFQRGEKTSIPVFDISMYTEAAEEIVKACSPSWWIHGWVEKVRDFAPS